MGKFRESYARRVDSIRRYCSDNKVFLVAAAAALILLCCGAFSAHGERKAKEAEEQSTEEEAQTAPLKWHFYPADAIVLGVGGTVCVVMIIRERKKAREGKH